MIRTLPAPQNLIVGIFMVLLAATMAIAPLPLLYRSLGMLFATYLALSAGGVGFAYLAAIIAPLTGLIGGDQDWLVMLPIILSGQLLAVLALEYAWKYPALLLSPLLAILPALIAAQLSGQSLFSIELPWGAANLWLMLHGLTALAGSLLLVVLDRQRSKNSPQV